MTTMETYQLKWHSHSNHLNGSVASLLRSDKFTDVVLCTVDGSQIPAHKFILGSCSVYLSNLFDGQRMLMRASNNMFYIVLPPEITTKALQTLVEYMYKGETTVSNDILDTVLKAGEILKVRGLWRHNESDANDLNLEKTLVSTTSKTVNKKPEEASPLPKITLRKEDNKLLPSFTPVQQGNVTRPMFIGPPKLVFIKTGDGANSGLRQIAPKGSTILVTPMEKGDKPPVSVESPQEKKEEPPKILNKKNDKKYGKRSKTDDDKQEEDMKKEAQDMGMKCEVPLTRIKQEPSWSEEQDPDDRTIANLFHTEMNIKSEQVDEDGGTADNSEEDEEQLYSPLTCELCSEVFRMPGAWVRHIQAHAESGLHTRKRRKRSNEDESDEMALLRCDLCQKHFPNPAEWVRHIQSTHTETEGVQSKTCPQCEKVFPSHASMVIHLRTHTGERPFICGLCNKGFNVKSNLLRHLRTLHDQIINPSDMEEEEEPVAPQP